MTKVFYRSNSDDTNDEATTSQSKNANREQDPPVKIDNTEKEATKANKIQANISINNDDNSHQKHRKRRYKMEQYPSNDNDSPKMMKRNQDHPSMSFYDPLEKKEKSVDERKQKREELVLKLYQFHKTLGNPGEGRTYKKVSDESKEIE
ncbi:24583_t:CDS:2 [Cetraspora pellucida]|uniref:24583_t:CDS:1 n=1 Tax=Cetraspora pellucida TaxID=1433469 RepID=A0A9N9DSR2_9GLOM|nr:24583_t:CDS:2 [Cetraspora pellucida]